jgi:excinuclease ABC subunit B
VAKQIKELIDGVYDGKKRQRGKAGDEDAVSVEKLGEKGLAKEIKRLEKQMLEHAKNLEFEKAAKMRDQLSVLREQAFGASAGNVVPFVPNRAA